MESVGLIHNQEAGKAPYKSTFKISYKNDFFISIKGG
jgi:hypothetical protein